MKIRPDIKLDTVCSVSNEFLHTNEIYAVILDIDNTIVANGSYDIPAEIETWLKHIEVSVFFLSNGREKRVKYFADRFGIKYRHRAKKPFPHGYSEVAEVFGVASKNIAVIGDQLLSDILGGNLAGCFTIKVQPLNPASDPF
jgi:HAD superfamily phosphatase (TIGR01668 family)